MVMPNILPRLYHSGSAERAFVQRFQLGAAGVVGFCHLPLQNFQPFPVVVQFHEQPFQFVLVLGKPGLKFLFCCHGSALHFRQRRHGGNCTVTAGGDAGGFVGKGEDAFQLFHLRVLRFSLHSLDSAAPKKVSPAPLVSPTLQGTPATWPVLSPKR